MAEMVFDSEADLDAALTSEAGAESARDLRNFAGAGVTHVHRTRRGRCLSPARRSPSDPATLGYRRIRYDRDADAGVATVTIDRPEVLNALDLPTHDRAVARVRAGVVGRLGRGGRAHRRR